MLVGLAALEAAIEADIVNRVRSSGTTDARGMLARSRCTSRGLKRLAASAEEGDRLVVDALSREHLTSVLAKHEGLDRRARRQVGRMRGLMSGSELVRAADGAGLAIVAVVPYGVLLGGPLPGLSHLAGLENTRRWRRTLSWLPAERELNDLVLAIERLIVSRLPSVVAHRLIVVLDRRADPAGNRAWLRGQRSAVSSWVEGADAGEPLLSPDEVVELDHLLDPAHARYLGFALLSAVQQKLPHVDPGVLLTDERAGQYTAWRAALAVDESVTRFMRGWAEGCRPRFRRGVDTTLVADYELVSDVLERQLQLFTEVR